MKSSGYSLKCLINVQLTNIPYLEKVNRHTLSPSTMTEFHPKLHCGSVVPSPSSVPPLLGRGRNSVAKKPRGIDSFKEAEHTQNKDQIKD